jgi:sigma-B regulation protein RsbU (phosphoserine phosphatase)
VHIRPGDALVLFTDGVSEAMDEAGEEWGEEPMERIVKLHLGESAETILSRLVEGIKAHSKETAQSDDITMIVAKKLG